MFSNPSAYAEIWRHSTAKEIARRPYQRHHPRKDSASRLPTRVGLDDEHIRSLLVSVARSFPIGAVMLLETGGEAKFQIRPVEGIALDAGVNAERLILDGQQRLTSLTQVLALQKPVDTTDDKNGKSSASIH